MVSIAEVWYRHCFKLELLGSKMNTLMTEVSLLLLLINQYGGSLECILLKHLRERG